MRDYGDEVGIPLVERVHDEARLRPEVWRERYERLRALVRRAHAQRAIDPALLVDNLGLRDEITRVEQVACCAEVARFMTQEGVIRVSLLERPDRGVVTMADAYVVSDWEALEALDAEIAHEEGG